jgi:hypothetical protein
LIEKIYKLESVIKSSEDEGASLSKNNNKMKEELK